MNIYLLERDDFGGYDTYDSCVVVAKDIEQASLITPNGKLYIMERRNTWVPPEMVTVTLLGKSLEKEPKVICASFNAG